MTHLQDQLKKNEEEFDKMPTYLPNGKSYDERIKSHLHSSSTKIIEAHTKDIIEMIEEKRPTTPYPNAGNMYSKELTKEEKELDQTLSDLILSLKTTIEE